MSDRAYDILKMFAQVSPISDENLDEKIFSEDAFQYLLSNNLIDCKITDYDIDKDFIPIVSEYSITEQGRGYLSKIEANSEFFFSVKSIASSAKQQADSAKSQAESALKQVSVLEKRLELAQQEAHDAEKSASLSKKLSIAALIIASIDILKDIALYILQLF